MEGAAAPTVCISVQSLAGETVAEFRDLAASTTVRELRQVVAAAAGTKGLKLVRDGETMRDDRTLEEEGLETPASLTAVFLVSPEGCVGHWSLHGELSQGCRDLSGNGNTAALGHRNPVKAGVDAFTFACGAGLRVPASPSLNVRHAMTVTCWFKAHGPCDGPLINFEPEWNAHVWVVPDRKFFARMTNGRLGWEGVQAAVARRPLPLRQWHFLAATHSAEAGRTALWVQGRLAAELDAGHHELGTAGDISIGEHGGRFLSADARDLRLYGRVLTTDELEVVAQEMPPPDAPEISFRGDPVESGSEEDGDSDSG